MRRLLAALILVWAVGTTALAQTPASFPVQATLPRAAALFLLRDADSSTRVIILLPAGTTVEVLRRDGPWYRVRFTTAAGEQLGLMAPWDLLIDPTAAAASPQTARDKLSARGFMEGQVLAFPDEAPSDTIRAMGDALLRQEVFVKPAGWLQFAMGLDLRASSHGQVEDEWRLDVEDRGVLRPRASLRRLSAAITTGHVSLDLGKQFVRWGRTDVLSPVDRFAPRDYLNIVNSEFIPVIGARMAVHAGGETLEAVWVPRMTPSRLPLLGRRWAVLPPQVGGFSVELGDAIVPSSSQRGVRWSHTGRFEVGLSYFDGFNHLPNLDATVDTDRAAVVLSRTFSPIRTYGAEVAVPTRALTLKGEMAYFRSPTSASDEYVLYVIEAERQMGEWLLDIGYAGEVVTTARAASVFAPERGMARSIIGHASYTITPRRSLQLEGAARQDGRGLYVKGEFSQTFGRHWRLTLAAAGLGGKDDDFLGQYNRNSHASATLRLSY